MSLSDETQRCDYRMCQSFLRVYSFDGRLSAVMVRGAAPFFSGPGLIYIWAAAHHSFRKTTIHLPSLPSSFDPRHLVRCIEPIPFGRLTYIDLTFLVYIYIYFLSHQPCPV